MVQVACPYRSSPKSILMCQLKCECSIMSTIRFIHVRMYWFIQQASRPTYFPQPPAQWAPLASLVPQGAHSTHSLAWTAHVVFGTHPPIYVYISTQCIYWKYTQMYTLMKNMWEIYIYNYIEKNVKFRRRKFFLNFSVLLLQCLFIFTSENVVNCWTFS